MLDGNSAEAHTSLAHVKATQDWDWHGAEREFQMAISLDPALRDRASLVRDVVPGAAGPPRRSARGDADRAVARPGVVDRRARPRARSTFYRRDFEAALEQCDHTIELNPHFSPAYWALGVIQEQRKDFDEAAAAFQRAIDLSPHSPRMHAALARTLALSGKRKQALAVAAQARGDRASSATCRRSSSPAMRVRARPGDEWVSAGCDKACEDRAFDVLALKVDPRFEALHDDRRFREILVEIGLT